MPPSDLLSALFDLVRASAHGGSPQALNRRDAPATRSLRALVDRPAPPGALGELTGAVDRMCRQGRSPDLGLGDLRRFDLETFRSALWATGPRPVKTTPDDPSRVLDSLRYQGFVRGNDCIPPVPAARSC
jgi:hypothetical protein